MRKFPVLSVVCALCVVFLVGCDVPTPPPELPTATPGSQNPESPLSRLGLTPIIPTPVRGFEPLKVPPGHIYFVRDSHLWKINPDGSGETQLSALAVNNQPQPSPDGKWVAFASDKDVYVLPAGGGEARKLASGTLAERQRLGWSSDSLFVGYLAFDLSTAGATSAFAVTVKGDKPQLITTLTEATSGRGPSYQGAVLWSPDGQWVLVSGTNNPMQLLRWPLQSGDASGKRDIAGGEPDWAPDSRTIVYAETVNGALAVYYAVEAAATPFRDEQQSVGTRLGEYAQGPGPRWSPASSGIDSDLIAYRSRSPAGEPRVSIRRRGGRELPPLANLTNNPSWSPSGDRLVVETGLMKHDSFGLNWAADGLSIVTVNSTGEYKFSRLVQNAQWPAWGP